MLKLAAVIALLGLVAAQDDLQRSTRFLECDVGRGIKDVSFENADAGFHAKCDKLENCARFCFESRHTCRAGQVAANGNYYVAGFDVTKDGSYLLYCVWRRSKLTSRVVRTSRLTLRLAAWRRHSRPTLL
jgi:hypothetical protein